MAAVQGTGALGACLHIMGSVSIVFGQTIVKVAQLIEETSGCRNTWLVQLQPGQEPPQWKRPDGQWRRQWLGSKGCSVAGWSAFVVGNLLRFASMRFGSQIVLSGLTSVQFVVIPAASYWLLGERLTWSSIGGIATVVAGNALIVAYGPGEVVFSLEQLRHQWTLPSVKLFLLALLLALAAMHTGIWYIERVQAQQQGDVRSRWRAQMKRHTHVTTIVHAVLFSAFAAFIGAWSVLFSKSLTYILTAPWPSQLTDWYAWLVLAAFLSTAGFWVQRTNAGLHRFSTALIIPLLQAFWMVQGVVAGGIYFDEFAVMHSDHIAYLVIGLVLAITGAMFMGCAGFMAEQHAMVSVTILPGFAQVDEGLTESSLKNLRFTALLEGSEADVESPVRGMGREGDEELEAQSSQGSALSHHTSAELHSSNWQDNMAVLQDRAKALDGKSLSRSSSRSGAAAMDVHAVAAGGYYDAASPAYCWHNPLAAQLAVQPHEIEMQAAQQPAGENGYMKHSDDSTTEEDRVILGQHASAINASMHDLSGFRPACAEPESPAMHSANSDRISFVTADESRSMWSAAHSETTDRFMDAADDPSQLLVGGHESSSPRDHALGYFNQHEAAPSGLLQGLQRLRIFMTGDVPHEQLH